MRKKIVGVLAAVFVVGSFVVPGKIANLVCPDMVSVAGAEVIERTEGDYKYVVRDNGTIKITKYIGNDEKVKVPDTLVDEKVTIIGSEAFAEGDCRKIVVPDGVQIIGERAFADCTELKKISLPDSVKTIGKEAFAGCEELRNISLPEKLKKLQTSVFDGCTALRRVTVPQKVRIDDKALGYDGERKLSDFEIRCYEDSAAQTYAIENDFDYTVYKAKPKAKPTQTPEAVEKTPEPTPYEQDLNTPKPSAAPDQEANAIKEEKQKKEPAGKQEPNTVAAALAAVGSIIGIIGCIVIVARRRR